mmetsp:Transcript_8383/g.14490  ORF Transcript_8383/g.14490 Transcript_8383/m.14490 type:complete len:203 (+) Transcript_8383:1-609(+)
MAKILGVYTVEVSAPYRPTVTSEVVVMENLHYGRRMSRVYDLKGSVRSRYADPDAEGAVLQDENLLELMFTTPFCLSEASKLRLAWSIYNDVRFLSSQLVLDYSLLVAVDKERGELVVGIIDYLTSWSNTKRAEFELKRTGLLGQRGKLPTIVPPNDYADRFRDALWHYFVLIPDKFTKLYMTKVTKNHQIAYLLDVNEDML